MSEPKSKPSTPPPQPQDGWVRKFELDEYLDRCLPIPTQVITNEEFDPIPQTAQQKAVESVLLETADRNARRLGISRRQFLRTSCGMAAAFAALNSVYGNFFTVHAAELFDPAASEEKIDYFILDAQTHHVATPREAPKASEQFLKGLLNLRKAPFIPELKGREPEIGDIYRMNYIKEVFLDSDTDVAVISALPAESEEASILPPDVMARTRSWVNELTSSRRVIIHGVFAPELGNRNLESMQVQAEKVKIHSWKGYTGVSMSRSVDGWYISDEKLAYPALELSRKLGIKNICLHKGLPFPGNPDYWKPMDVLQAAKDFPDLNFLVYHSGFRGLEHALPKTEDRFQKDAYVPWVSDMCEARRKNPQLKNVYMELGSTFGLMVATSPVLCAHVLGMILDAFGEDNVLWGTDSIWWGSPRWQIEAFRRLEMPEDLMKRFGYRPLTTEVKRKIFGLNGARVYDVDPAEKRNPVPPDYIDRLKKMYKEEMAFTPSNTQYGWVRARDARA